MGRLRLSAIWLTLLVALPLFANNSDPKHIDWNTLADVVFKEKYYAQTKEWYLFPNFSANIKSLEGKYVKIKGYVIPLDIDNDVYALSAYPFAACFFCGGAGPESVMSLKFSGKTKSYKVDQVVTFAGNLRLNDTDINEFNYILENVKEWK